jgi:hypothetical protein
MPLGADTVEIQRTLKALNNPLIELRMISDGKFKRPSPVGSIRSTTPRSPLRRRDSKARRSTSL